MLLTSEGSFKKELKTLKDPDSLSAAASVQRVSLILIRHGETAWNAARIVQLPDTPLNDNGFRQAERVGARMAGHSIGGILSSDYQRTQFGGWPWPEDAVTFPRDKGRFALVGGKEEAGPGGVAGLRGHVEL